MAEFYINVGDIGAHTLSQEIPLARIVSHSYPADRRRISNRRHSTAMQTLASLRRCFEGPLALCALQCLSWSGLMRNRRGAGRVAGRRIFDRIAIGTIGAVLLASTTGMSVLNSAIVSQQANAARRTSGVAEIFDRKGQLIQRIENTGVVQRVNPMMSALRANPANLKSARKYLEFFARHSKAGKASLAGTLAALEALSAPTPEGFHAGVAKLHVTVRTREVNDGGVQMLEKTYWIHDAMRARLVLPPVSSTGGLSDDPGGFADFEAPTSEMLESSQVEFVAPTSWLPTEDCEWEGQPSECATQEQIDDGMSVMLTMQDDANALNGEIEGDISSFDSYCDVYGCGGGDDGVCEPGNEADCDPDWETSPVSPMATGHEVNVNEANEPNVDSLSGLETIADDSPFLSDHSSRSQAGGSRAQAALGLPDPCAGDKANTRAAMLTTFSAIAFGIICLCAPVAIGVAIAGVIAGALGAWAGFDWTRAAFMSLRACMVAAT